MKVFLSYAIADRAIADRLTRELAARGITVWFDQNEILAGDSIVERVNEGIRSADFLIVLLSAHSVESSWVQHEIRTAFVRFADKAGMAVIPVKIDNSPVPVDLQTIRYVDISDKTVDDGVREIVERLRPHDAGKMPLTELINADDLAIDLASDRKIPRGVEFYVTAILGALTIVATLVAAWPSFQTAFAQVPKVYYDVKQNAISLPPGTDERKAIRILRDAGIAPGALRIRVVNKGQVVAKETKVGAQTSGSFLYMKTDPLTTSKTVWGSISAEPVTSGDKESAVHVRDFAPDKPVVINLGFEPVDAQTSTDVLTDGVLTEKVSNIELIPKWTLWTAIQWPVTVLIIGVVASLAGGAIFAAWRNPRLRITMLDLLEAISPPSAALIRVFARQAK